MKEYKKSEPEPSFLKPTRKSGIDNEYPDSRNPDEDSKMPDRSMPITN